MFALIALPSFFDELVPYLIVGKSPIPGIRVHVPFGKQTKIGIVVSLVNTTHLDKSTIKPLGTYIDLNPIIPQYWLNLSHKLANYYHISINTVILTMLPPLLKKDSDFKPLPLWLSKASNASRNNLTPRGKKLYDFIATTTLSRKQLKTEGFSRRLLSELYLNTTLEKKTNPHVLSLNNPTLNKHQQHVAKQIYWGSFNTFLLHGITGSGKTEVYAQWINECIQQGKQALVLIPEIGLTPQTLQRFQGLNIPIACLHSRLSDQERADQWLDITNGDAKLILGTRSAIFAPTNNLGIIIIDEEHDTSFKQQTQWRYHARDIGAFLAKQLNIPLVLGSATPSLESLHNVSIKKYQLLQLTERYNSQTLPEILPIDCRKQPLNNGFALQTLNTIKNCLTKKHQVMVYLNRRGYSPVSLCHECGEPARCTSCDRLMTYHKLNKTLQCHHCNVHQVLSNCQHCPSTQWVHYGQGTENINEFLAEYFQCSVIRLDRDTTSTYEKFSTLLKQAQNHEAPIIVGTQMLSKGHNFPDLRLVVILNVDQYFYSQDFRASESLTQQVIQVAGRCGRYAPGKVLLQTLRNDHPLINMLTKHDYMVASQWILEDRKRFGFPPYQCLAIIRANSKQEKSALNCLKEYYQSVVKVQPSNILQPQPSSFVKKLGTYYYYCLLHHQTKGSLHALISELDPIFKAIKSKYKRVNLHLELDPTEF
jgi:primosomal protein N' (replication factor Y) (superfamily II helicase)